MGILSQIFGKPDALQIDAQRLYRSLMQQSRRATFYGKGRIIDNYDGRIDVLTLHMACVLKALYASGPQGARLAQALFDEMKDDFEVALRELGIADTGVAKRMKPMISYFYARVKIYDAALKQPVQEDISLDALWLAFEDLAQREEAEINEAQNDEALIDQTVIDDAFRGHIMHYMRSLDQQLSALSLGQIALCEFEYPDFT